MSTDDRPETERQKRIRRTQEATVYRVQEDLVRGSGVYRVSKRVLDVETELFHVEIKRTSEGNELLWCDCAGFRRQKFELKKHKHIRIVHDFIARGSPEWIEYRLIGGGKNTKIRFVRSNKE